VSRPVFLVWSGWLVLMAGTNLATPLYAVYAQRFHFSSLVLTSIFVTYAVVLVPSLVLFGRLSDRFGRRLVILAGLAVAAAGLVLFASADGEAWLYGARALQGLAVGMISGAATAALVELDPDGDRRRAALFAGLAQVGGSGLGPIVAGVLAQWAPDPLRLAFFAGIGATVVAALAMLALVDEDGGEREPWRVQWPRVPEERRTDFARVSLAAAMSWATLALFLSVVPSYARASLHMHNLAALAAVASAALAASSVSQIVSQRRHPSVRGSQAAGLVVLACGLVLLVVAAPLRSLALLVVSAVAAGAGHGVAVLNAQEELNELAPAERRGEVSSAFIACIYGVLACVVVGTGLLALGVSLTVSVGAVSIALAAAALLGASWQAAILPPWRRRSSSSRSRVAPSR
jgi:predicted MFS family arabinose efflux permease